MMPAIPGPPPAIADCLFGFDDVHDIVERQRLEVQPVAGVIVGRHRLGVAVDHDGFVASFTQGEAGVHAAVVELDALPDAVRPRTQE